MSASTCVATDTEEDFSPRRWTKGARQAFSGVPPKTFFNPHPGSKVESREVPTPVHHFITGRRKAQWREGATLPPRIYLDQMTIIRPVPHVTDLRRGDHCLITLNALRCLNPTVDYLVSLLGSLEMYKWYHHFILLDDVRSVDKNGIPLTADGKIATILEYSNSIPEFLEEVRVNSLGSWILYPFAFFKLLLKKAKCHRVALADYGDMPHIFRVQEKLDDADRSRIVSDAEKMLMDAPKYNILWANCEHTTNIVSAKRQFTSPEVHFFLCSVARHLVSLVGLVLLHVLLVGCYKKYCIQHPVWALCAYYTFTAVPVMLQSFIMYGRVAWALRYNYTQNMLSRDDLYHLLLKELLRGVVVGGFSVFVIALMPFILHHSDGMLYNITMSLAVVFAYMGSDIVYSLLTQLSVRLLLRWFGRFWLHGGSPLTREEEQKLKAEIVAKKAE